MLPISDLLPELVERLSRGSGSQEPVEPTSRSTEFADQPPEPATPSAVGRDVISVLGCWQDVAPSIWQESASPVRFADGELVVAVADGAAASVLRFRVGSLMDAYNEYFREPLVRTVRVVLTR